MKAEKFGFGVSPKYSFKFWDVWEFIKGRKKMAITVIATVLSYLISNDATISLVAGVIVEGLWASAAFYVKEKEL